MATGTEPTRVSALVARQRIHGAIIQMGLSFADCVHLIVFDPDVDTACWAYNRTTGEESIRIGYEVASLTVNDIEIVIRHEFLHRATYHGFSERFHDSDLCNIVEDVCINRLLFEAYEEKMQHLASCFYPEESKTTVIALADCSAEPENLPVALMELWHYVWDRAEDGSMRYINPTSLYFRLVEVRSANPELSFVTNWIFGKPMPGGMLPEPSMRVRIPIERINDAINQRLPSGSSLGREVSSFSVVPQMIGFSSIERFLREIQYTTEAQSMNSLLEAEPRTARQAFPMFPSRRGILYKLLDLERELGYLNEVIDWRSKQLKLGFYVDVSGSMREFFPVLSSFVRVFKAFPLKLYGFATAVIPLDVSQIIGGNMPGGNCTDFNAPMLDFIADKELAGGILFTDGLAGIDPATAESFRESGKVLFVVYFHRPGKEVHSKQLDALANRTAMFEVAVE
ncbi:MAG: hypothetical protein ACOYM2_16195 [Rectinemataceae bacterium]